MDTFLIFLLGIVILIFLFAIIIFNSLVTLKNNRNQAFSDIDVQLKLRYDLVPNLVSIVKGYASHEKELFEKIADARNKALGAASVNDKIAADNEVSSSLKSLFAIAENYPVLKANENFLALQKELSDIENKIAAARRFFNNSTKEFNSMIMQFPNSILAKMFNMKEEMFFGINSDEKENIAIKL